MANNSELLIEYWFQQLYAAELRYTTNRTKETHASYLRVLKIFSQLVVDNKIPTEDA